MIKDVGHQFFPFYQGMVARTFNTFNPNVWEADMVICEFKASMGQCILRWAEDYRWGYRY